MRNSEFVRQVSAMAGELAEAKATIKRQAEHIDMLREALALNCAHANMAMRGTNIVCPDCQTVQSML
jgi:hypothetical protein